LQSIALMGLISRRVTKLINIRTISGPVRFLHRSRFLRKIAKRLARNLTLTQPFHGGQIAFNAVTHSWAWTGSRNYENFDRALQDRLLALSLERPRFLDIGANIGAMTLSVLLRNAAASALAVEPGSDAVRLLRYSLRLNRLEDRCEIMDVAASAGDRSLNFDPSGSVMGHVSANGPSMAAVDIREIVHRFEGPRPFLMKIDVEGYETALLAAFCQVAAPSGSCAVIELHPLGLNGLGDPQHCFELLAAEPRFSVRAFGGAPLDRVNPGQFTQIEVCWR